MGDGRTAAVLKRKAAPRGAAPVDASGNLLPRTGRAFCDSLKRLGEDMLGLAVASEPPVESRATPSELLESLPDAPFLAVLEGPGGGAGLLVLDLPLLSGLIEALTTGRVNPQPPLARRPTRTDAGLLEDLIDRFLAGFEAPLLEHEEARWASGWRYQLFLSEPRPLQVVLAEASHRVLRATVSLQDGLRSGTLTLAVPAVGRAEPRAPARPKGGSYEARRAAEWSEGFTRNLDLSAASVEAVLGRVRLPLAKVSRLGIGDRIALPMEALAQVRVIGPDGTPVALGRLGRAEGRRAVKIAEADPIDLNAPLREGELIEAGVLATRSPRSDIRPLPGASAPEGEEETPGFAMSAMPLQDDGEAPAE